MAHINKYIILHTDGSIQDNIVAKTKQERRDVYQAFCQLNKGGHEVVSLYDGKWDRKFDDVVGQKWVAFTDGQTPNEFNPQATAIMSKFFQSAVTGAVLVVNMTLQELSQKMSS